MAFREKSLMRNKNPRRSGVKRGRISKKILDMEVFHPKQELLKVTA